MAGWLGGNKGGSGLLGMGGLQTAHNPYEVNPYYDMQYPVYGNDLTPEQNHILRLLHGGELQHQNQNQTAPLAPWTVFPAGGVRG